jgi:hypothetical protein
MAREAVCTFKACYTVLSAAGTYSVRLPWGAAASLGRGGDLAGAGAECVRAVLRGGLSLVEALRGDVRCCPDLLPAATSAFSEPEVARPLLAAAGLAPALSFDVPPSSDAEAEAEAALSLGASLCRSGKPEGTVGSREVSCTDL